MTREIRVLLVEDRPADAERLVRELERAGFTVDWTRVASEADYLARLDPPPDVVLADYGLPGFGAMQALGHLAARGLDVPVIVVSGTVVDEVAVECLKGGAADYLLKDRLARLGSAVGHVVARKRTREQHRRAEEVAEALATVGRELTLALDPTVVADRIVATVGRLFRVRRVLLLRRDPESELLVCIAAVDVGDARRWIGQGVPLDTSIAGLAFADGRATCTADVLTDPRVMLGDAAFQRIREDGLRAVAAVPLRVRTEILGVLTLEDGPGRAFGEDELRILSAFADQAAVALQNARLFGETQDRLQQTQMLLAVGQATSSTLDRTEMLRRVARETGRALGADMVAALVPEAGGDELRTVAGYHVPKPLLPALRELRIPLKGHEFFVEAWEHQRAVFSTEVAADLRIEPRLLAYVPFRSLLFIPMLNRHDLVGGLLAAWRSHVQEFTPETLGLAEGIGRQAAMGFENARLFEDAERRRRRIESLAALDRLLSESLDPGDVAQRIADSLRSLLDAGSAALYRLVPESRTLAPLAMSGDEGRRIDAVPPIPIGTGLVGLAVQETRALTSPDALADPRVGAGPATISTPEADHRALLAVPLVSHGRPIGALAVKDRAGRVFDADEVFLAEAFAERAAQALQNARHHAEAQRRGREAAGLAAVARTLAESLEAGEVGRRIVQSVLPLFDATLATLRLLRPDGSLVLVAIAGALDRLLEPGHVLPPGLGVAGRAVAEGRAVWVSAAEGEADIVPADDDPGSPRAAAPGARLAAPLRTPAGVLGVLSIGYGATRAFSDAEAALLQAFADQAALALQNARHYEEAQRRRQEAGELATVARSLAETLDATEIGHRIVQSLIPVFRASLSTLRLLQPDGTLVLAATAGALRAPFERGHAMPVGPGVVGRAVTVGHAVWGRADDGEMGSGLSDDDRRRLSRTGVGAVLAAPLRTPAGVLGVLVVGYDHPRTFTELEGELLQAFADQAALALQNARHYEAAERRRREAEALAELTQTLNEPLDVEAVGAYVVAAVRRHFGAAASVLRLLEPDGTLAGTAWSRESGDPGRDAPDPAAGTVLVRRAVTEGRPVWSRDVSDDPDAPPGAGIGDGGGTAGTRAVLAVPLRAHGRVTGVLSVEHRAARVFPEAEVALLQAFADQGALALQNARHFAESERRRKAAEALAEMGRLISQSLDPDDVGARIVESVRALFGALHAVFHRLDPRTGDLVAVAFTGEMGPGYPRAKILARGTGVAGRAVREARPVVTPDVLTDPRIVLTPGDRVRVEQAAFRAVLAVPLVVQDRVIGALTVADRAGRTFAREEIELAQAIGQHAALAVENARLYADSEHRRRQAEALTQLTQALTGSLDVGTVAQEVVDRVQRMFGSRLTGLRLLQPDGSLRAVAGAGVGRHLFPPGHVQPPGVGMVGHVVAAGRPGWTPDLLSEPDIVLTEDLRGRLADDTRALLVAPLKTEGETIGVLVIADRTGRTFTEAEIGFLGAVADQAALALQNARSHEAAVRRGQELAALLRAARTVMAGLDLDTTLQRIVEEASRIAGTPHVQLLLVEAAAGELRLGAIAGSPVPPAFRVPVGTSYSGTVASTGRPLYVADTQNDPENPLAARDREQGIRTYLGLPVRFGDEVLGVLTFNTTRPHEYGGAELAYLASFADQAALAVRNARLLQEARVRQARLEALLDVSRELSRIQSVEPLLDRIAEACGQLLGTDSVGFRLLEGDELVVSGATGDARETMATTRLRVGESLSGLVAQTGETLVVANLADDPRLLPEHRAAVVRAGHRAWLGVPVKAGDRILGVLSVRTPRAEGFSREDVVLAGAFASQAATALENARLYQQSQQAYEELARAQGQLIHAEKMQAVGRLAGGVAHDFNNLLTVIIGRSQMLVRRLPAGDPLHRYAVLIHQTGERAAALTQQLLAFSRRQVLQPSVLDLNDVVAGMDKMLRRLIGEDVELVTEVGIGLGRVKADQAQLEQVLMNLVVNARDAMPRGGRLTIATRNVEVDADALRARPDAAPGPYVSLEVSDTGTGMDAETRARVFEPFFTTKGPGKGTGLGLATVFGVVRQSEGYVWVESEPGRGSTFTIHLPRVDEPVAAARQPGGGQRVAQGTETVLLVEDEGELRDLTGEMLEALGYRILKAGDGKQALVVAARHAGRIDLLLTDVIMPQMSGRELASRLVESRPGVRILYMSGYTDEAISHHGVLDPGTSLLQKPFDAEALARKIREVLDGGRAAARSGPEGAADDQPARSPA